MRMMMMTTTARRRYSFMPAAIVLPVLALPLTAAAQIEFSAENVVRTIGQRPGWHDGLKVRIVQTNMANDYISIIDPATNKVIAEVTGIEAAHGITGSPDGRWLYVTNEAERTVDVVDMDTLDEANQVHVVKQIPLSGGPHNIAISRDGRTVYAAMQHDATGVDVIDTETLTWVKNLPLNDRPEGRGEAGESLMRIHNVWVTPDGKNVIAGSNNREAMYAAIIDEQTHEWVRSIEYTGRPRPLAFNTNPDGSTKWVFAGISGLHGFVVHDFETGKEIFRTEFPSPVRDGGVNMARPGGLHPARLILANPNHGIGVTPDNTSVWVTDRLYSVVHAYSVPEFRYLGEVVLRGQDPFWVTFTPDSRFAYIPHANRPFVSVVDTAKRQEVASVLVGDTAKRISTVWLPF